MSVDEAKDQAEDETKAKGKNEDGTEDEPDDPGIGVSDDIEVSDEQKKQAEEMIETANQNRPTLVLPGSGKTITGGAVNEWLDDDGNPKYESTEDSKDSKDSKDSEESKDSTDSGDSEASKPDDDKPSADHADKAESQKDESKGGGSSRGNLTETSDRGARADENADDGDKSIEQLNKEAEERVKENFEKDKEFNAAVLKEAKEAEEANKKEKAST